MTRYAVLDDGSEGGALLRVLDGEGDGSGVFILADSGRWETAPDSVWEGDGGVYAVPGGDRVLAAAAEAAWERLLEEKVTRVVRTAAGAEKYGQPIGSVIIADSLDELYALLSPDEARKVRKRKAAVKFYAQRRDGLTAEAAQAKADAWEQSALEDLLKDEAVEAGVLAPWEAVPGEDLEVSPPGDDFSYLDTYTDDALLVQHEAAAEEYRLLAKEAARLPEGGGEAEDVGYESRAEEIEGRQAWLEELTIAVERRQALRLDARAALRAGPAPERPPVGAVGTYRGEPAEILEHGGPKVGWMLRVRWHGEDWNWVEAAEFEPFAPEPAEPAAPKKKKVALHPPSGRPDPLEDPLTRGGGGPLLGYTAGQRAYLYEHGAWTLVEVVDGETEVDVSKRWIPGRDRQGSETQSERTLHMVMVQRLRPDGTPPTEGPYTKPTRVGVENMVPLGTFANAETAADPRPGLTLSPDMAAADSAVLPLEALLPADSLAAVRRSLKKKSVALDTVSDSYEGQLTPELLALENAKADGVRALGRAFGFTEDETEQAVSRLDSMLSAWAVQGGVFDERLAMHAAVKRLRAGETATDADTRAMLLQRAWSHAVWDARYGRDTGPQPVSRFVQAQHAAVLAAADTLTRPVQVADAERGYQGGVKEIPAPLAAADVSVDAWTLTSWSLTPDGVHAGFVGRYVSSVQLETEVSRDEVWLNVWGEPLFRSRGLKAPGEVIVDNRRQLSLENVKVTFHAADESKRPPNSFGGMTTGVLAGWAGAFVQHVLRVPDSTPAAAAAGMELTANPYLDTPLFDNEVREFGRAATAEAEGRGPGGLVPAVPKTQYVWRDKVTGERVDRGVKYSSSSRYNPTYEDRQSGQYEQVLDVVSDAAVEGLFDRAAALTSARGGTWTQAGLERYREAAVAWLDGYKDLYALREGRYFEVFPGYPPPKREAYPGLLAEAEKAEARTRSALKQRAERLGYMLDDETLDAYLAEHWTVPSDSSLYTGASFRDRAKTIPWWTA